MCKSVRADTENTSQKSLRRLFVERTHLVDFGFICTFPAILLLVYQLPYAVRESLVFDYTDPTVVTAFTSSFVHLETGHLLTNVFLYLVVVPTLYLLGIASGNRQRFYIFVSTVLVAFPPVLSYLNLAIIRSSATLGASGVVMGLVGCLPLTLADYLESRFAIGPVRTFAPMMFLTSLGLVSVLSVQSVVPENSTVLFVTAGLVLAVFLTVLFYAISAYEQVDNILSKLRSSADATGYFELSVAAIFLFVTVLFVAFPVDPTTENGVVNLYEHFVGYSLGFIASFTTVEVLNQFGR